MTHEPHPADDPAAAAAAEPSPLHRSRQQLIWDLLVFQVKLIADGVLDLVLSGVALSAAVLGLIAGGDDPHQYFRRVLRFGRRTEVWINLFGVRYRRGTSDEMMDGLRERVFTEAASNPWLGQAGSRLNAKLDAFSASRTGSAEGATPQSAKQAPSGPAPSGAPPEVAGTEPRSPHER